MGCKLKYLLHFAILANATLATWSCAAFSAVGTNDREQLLAESFQTASTSQAVLSFEDYQVKKHDHATSILFSKGIGTEDSPYHMYGKQGLLNLLRELNPQVDLDILTVGTVIRVPVVTMPPVAILPAAKDPLAHDRLDLLLFTKDAVATDKELGDTNGIIPEVSALLNQLTTEHADRASLRLPYRIETAIQECTVRREAYQVQAGDTLSSLLLARGIGTPDTKERIFGDSGWSRKTELENPHILDWKKLRIGESITLVYPERLVDHRCTVLGQLQVQAAEPLPSPAPVIVDPLVNPVTATEELQQVIARPDEATLSQITRVPAEDLAHIPPEIIAAKLDEASMVSLDDSAVAAIPQAAVQEKAADVSIFDSTDPGMAKLFSGLKLSTPAAYVGIRAGFAVGDRTDPLTSKIRMVGLVGEIRDGAFAGVRILYERVPRISANMDGYHLSLEFSRVLLGYALQLPAPFLFDLVHITPRLGQYDMTVTAPIGSFADGSPVIETLTVRRAIDTGVEVDTEFARYFYLLRFWAARDISLNSHSTDYSAAVTRAGVDCYIKGGGFSLFGQRMSPSYLAFVAYESILLKGSKEKKQRQ